MKPCPFCGVMLTAALVDAISDVTQPESCPVADKMNADIAALFEKATRALAEKIAEDTEFMAAIRSIRGAR